MAKVTGIVERFHFEGQQNACMVHIMIDGKIYSGQPSIQRYSRGTSADEVKCRLTNVGDEVSFSFERDFHNYIREFKNITLEQRLKDSETSKQ